jgi:hypothetical protein
MVRLVTHGEDKYERTIADIYLPVEHPVLVLPDLRAGVDWTLQLAIGEFEARRDTERPLSQDEISSRLADISDTLRERIQGLLPQHSPKLPAAGSSTTLSSKK